MKTLTERHVQAIWYDEKLRPGRLLTRRGVAVRVVDPGEWNLGAGPDFRHAVLELGAERRRIVGDVEVHLCPSDWDFHHHGADPNYRNVIAHVTWGCGPVPASLPSGAVSIWLGRFLTSDAGFDPAEIDLKAYPYANLPKSPRPCATRLANDPDAARRLLRDAGRHRLRMKARRLLGRLGPSAERRQIFYEEVMTALGYSRNVSQFRNVARRIPIAELPGEREAAKTALLTAGTFEEWDRVGLRPGNSPEQRLTNAATIFTETPMMALCEKRDFTPATCKMMLGTVCEPGAGGHCLGRGRAAAILANVVVPWAIAEERIDQAPEWLPAEDISSPVRLTAYRLFGRDHNPAVLYAGNGLHIQGLLQIHRDYCLQVHPDCQECALVNEIN